MTARRFNIQPIKIEVPMHRQGSNSRKTRPYQAVAILLITAVASLLYPTSGHADFDAFERLNTAKAALKFLDTGYTFPNDCTYFVSQALWDGGLPSTADWTPRTSDQSKLASKNVYNPGPSKAAANADIFTKYMQQSGMAVVKPITWSDNSTAGAELADVIAYDWNNGADGVIDHLALITSFTNDHHPNVSQHSPTRRDRYWSWDSDGKNWIEITHKGSRAYLIHFV